MKKIVIVLLAFALVGLIAAPSIQKIMSIKDLESKVHAATDGKKLNKVPSSLDFRVEGTDWFIAGYSCPYSEHQYSLSPATGIPGDYKLSIQSESNNALFFMNRERQITYVTLDRRDIDFCGVGSIEPNIPVIDF